MLHKESKMAAEMILDGRRIVQVAKRTSSEEVKEVITFAIAHI